jgi:hemoglobin
MKHILARLSRLALLATVCLVVQPSTAQAQDTPTLYQRLGGYDALAAVSDDFIARLATDPDLGRFFTGLSLDSQQRLRQHLVDQLCAATGGPCVYIGRDMKTSHEGLGITEEDWEKTVGHLVATLDAFNVPEAERQDLFALLTELKPDIVEQ